MDEWINKMWYVHTREYYLVLKRKEILTNDTTWKNFEDIILNEVLVKKRQISYYSIYKVPSKIHRGKNKMIIAKGWGVEEMKSYYS